MTHLLIHPKPEVQFDYLLEMLNQHLSKKVSDRIHLDSIPDVHIIDPTDENSIGIETVKNFQAEMIYQPFEESRQFGIILQSHKLTHESQNALLKTLEESSETTLYYLLARRAEDLLPTIVSRSVKHFLKSDEDSSKIQAPAVNPFIDIKDVNQAFLKAAELDKASKEEPELVKDALDRYISFLRDKLVKADSETFKFKDLLNEAVEAKSQLNSNVNKKLILENLMISYLNS